jgi:isochorismate synthase
MTDPAVVDAATRLLRRLHDGASGVCTIDLVGRLPVTTILDVLDATAPGGGERFAHLQAGDVDSNRGSFFVGFDAIDDVRADNDGSALAAEQAIARLLHGHPGRRLVVAVPFRASRATRTVWAPRLWLQQRTGSDHAVLGVDLAGATTTAIARLSALLQAMAARATTTTTPPTTPATLLRTDAPDQTAHAVAVHAALAAFARGDVEKVVLARKTTLQTGALDAHQHVALLRGLLSKEQRGMAYLVVNASGDAFFGCSPERLCVRTKTSLDVDALAGTAPRGGSREDDDALAARLREDGKERREHAAVVDAIVAALHPVSARLDVPAGPEIVRLGRVQHLHTPIHAELMHAAPVFSRLHPTPAVAGTPRAEAVDVIAQLEPFERGLYAGFVGVADDDGEHLTVALRCGRAHDGVVDVFAGGGLVAGAEPAREWLELEKKSSLVIDVIAEVLGARR